MLHSSLPIHHLILHNRLLHSMQTRLEHAHRLVHLVFELGQLPLNFFVLSH